MDAIAYAKASSAYKLAKLVETGLTNKVNLGESSIIVPVGTTANRPTLGAGESAIRYNSDVGGLEEWTGVEWKNVSADITAVTLKGTDTEVNILAKVGMLTEDLWIASDTLDGWVYDGLAWINIGPLRGPQGIQGIPGKSAYTVAVEGGFVGTEAQWLSSLIGEPGDTGNGIASIVKTGTVGLVDTYTVTMTNGAASTFTVTNGVDGVDGTDVDHISQTSGTGASGTVDTYTVWRDVSETINLGTFNVYNGTDGAGIVNSVAAGTNLIVDNTNPTIPVIGLSANVTVHGNTFNGAEQLVKLGVDGKLPTLDGSNLTGIDGLPDQTGFAGKYLKTDGIAATWEDVISDSTTSTTSTWSSDKINEEITEAVVNIDLSSKQNVLVSGTNIKTINGSSLLGSGDIETPVTTVNNTLTSTSTTEALSANQGMVLNEEKLSKSGGIMTGAITAIRETQISLGASSAIDLSLGNLFTKSVNSSTTFSVFNFLSSGASNSFILELVNAGAFTITWFNGIKWAGGAAPILTASGVDILGFYSYDGGVTWKGLVLGNNMK